MLALMILWGSVVRVLPGAARSTGLRLPGMTHAYNDGKACLVDRRQ